MLLTLVLFGLLFITFALLLLLVSGGSGKDSQQTLARLDAIRVQSPGFPGSDEPLIVRKEEVLSGIPALDRILQSLELARKVRLLLYQAGMSNWTPAKLVLTSLLAGLVGACLVYLRTESTFISLVLGMIVGSIPLLHVLRQRTKRFFKMKERLPETLDLMVSAIRAGHSFNSAMGMASKESPEPVKGEFRQCFDEQNYGMDLRIAIKHMVGRAPIREIRMIGAAVLIQKETGGNLTEILEKVSQLIREDFKLQREVATRTAQGRLTGWILTLLPIILGILLYLVDPEHMSLLWTRAVGIRALEAATVSTIIGGLIIRKIIRIQI
jgi:tight adherence protein B